jgi:hypothetical protein
MTATFAPDAKIAKIADAYALDVIDFAQKAFSVKLDWTDASIQGVEGILEKMHATIPTQKPPDDVIWNFAKGFGSYIGEVFRKNHGGEWGMITDGRNTFPGMRWKEDTLFWPWGRAHKRLVDGSENNVWHYYQSLVVNPKVQ